MCCRVGAWRAAVSAYTITCGGCHGQIDIKSDDPAVQKTEAMRFKTVLVQLKNEPATAGAE